MMQLRVEYITTITYMQTDCLVGVLHLPNKMKLLKFILIVMTITAGNFASAERKVCNIKTSLVENGLNFTAPSHQVNREPERARYGRRYAWCARTSVKFRDYLQVTFSGLRLISAVETGGLRLNFLNLYVKTFFISYSIDGKQWRIYKSGFSRRLKIFSSGDTVRHVNEICPAIVAQYVRIYPMQFKNKMCLKAQFYTCNETIAAPFHPEKITYPNTKQRVLPTTLPSANSKPKDEKENVTRQDLLQKQLKILNLQEEINLLEKEKLKLQILHLKELVNGTTSMSFD